MKKLLSQPSSGGNPPRRPRRDPLAVQRARALAALLEEPEATAALALLDTPGPGRAEAERRLAGDALLRARLATLGVPVGGGR